MSKQNEPSSWSTSGPEGTASGGSWSNDSKKANSGWSCSVVAAPIGVIVALVTFIHHRQHEERSAE